MKVLSQSSGLSSPFLLKFGIAEILKDVPAKQVEAQVEVFDAVRFNRDLQSASLVGVIRRSEEAQTEGLESIDVLPEQMVTTANGLRMQIFEQFSDIVTNEKPSGLPPERDVEHTIDLIEGTPFVNWYQLYWCHL
ncbi:unnamed protein product [Ambrosiozyma monospora]|uniref:Unnamed protein product n=1 Tax=Ambrosiozyma monospora TaxID=43982 RepID=A0ACB5SZZ7_AMBMO|nr:unnamed protein product [Ambrosiozyma monospora]